jgi:hypothetical protein
MKGDRSFAMNVLADSDLLDPAPSNRDPLAIVLEISPLQSEGLADAESRGCDEQSQNELRLVQLVKDGKSLLRGASDGLVVRRSLTVNVLERIKVGR